MGQDFFLFVFALGPRSRCYTWYQAGIYHNKPFFFSICENSVKKTIYTYIVVDLNLYSYCIPIIYKYNEMIKYTVSMNSDYNIDKVKC